VRGVYGRDNGRHFWTEDAEDSAKTLKVDGVKFAAYAAKNADGILAEL
jgi:hypothetical protein